MSNDCVECINNKRVNYNQMSVDERARYWDNFKRLANIDQTYDQEGHKSIHHSIINSRECTDEGKG